MIRKRGNGEGSQPRKRPDGRWETRYTVHTSEGPKRETLYGRTRQEVADKLARALSDRAQGLTFEVGSLKLGEYVDRWLADIRDTVRQRTWERYEQIARVHIKPALGRIKLKALTPTHVRGLYREKLDAGAEPPYGAIHTFNAAQGLEGRRIRWTRSAQRGRRHQTSETQEEGNHPSQSGASANVP